MWSYLLIFLVQKNKNLFILNCKDLYFKDFLIKSFNVISSFNLYSIIISAGLLDKLFIIAYTHFIVIIPKNYKYLAIKAANKITGFNYLFDYIERVATYELLYLFNTNYYYNYQHFS